MAFHLTEPKIIERGPYCVVGAYAICEGMTLTRFSGGEYVTVECGGDTENEAAMAVGPAINQLE